MVSLLLVEHTVYQCLPLSTSLIDTTVLEVEQEEKKSAKNDPRKINRDERNMLGR